MHIHAQMQAIVDKLVGVPFDSLPSPMDLDPPWRIIYCRVSRAPSWARAHSIIYQATADLPNPLSLANDLFALLPGEEQFTLVPSLWEMSDDFPPVEWLWPSWLPRGLLTLFGAAPGVGKSLVALDLARRIIHGQPFPDGAPVPCPGSNVLIVDAEAAPALLSQRVRAWNIDPRRLFLMPTPDPGGFIDLAHPGQQDLLAEICRSIQPALVVVDSLAAATTRGETSLEGARALLGFLSSIADESQAALLVIHHLRKRARSGGAPSSPQVVADDLRGSSHLSAAARSVLALSLVGGAPGSPASGLSGTHSPPGPASLRRLEVIKTNLCRHPPPLGLIFEGENVPVPTLRYVPLVEPPPPPTEVDLCAHWLLDLLTLAGAPVRPADVVRAASEAGFPRRTLYRARAALAGLVVDLGAGPRDPPTLGALAANPSLPPPDEPPPDRAQQNLGTVAQ